MAKILGDIVAGIISFIFGLFGGINTTGLQSALSFIAKYLKAACYFLPMGTVRAIFNIVVAIWSVRLVIRTIRIVADLIP